MKTTTGRVWDNSSRFSPDPQYKAPMVKVIIEDRVPDDSRIPRRICPRTGRA
jgi:hypothetical protein